MISPDIFRSYDIRGVYPKDLNEEAAITIGRAFASYIKAKTMVVGHDMRLSSPTLFKALCEGITNTGCNIVDLGEIPTEIMYYSVGKGNYDAGIMITASHNPKEYNGFKMIKKDNGNFSMLRGKDLYSRLNDTVVSKKKGIIEEIDLRQEYIDHVLSMYPSNVRKFKIAVDTGNGMAARWVPLLNIPIIPINFNIDGNFPSHPSNPLEKGVADELGRVIVKEKADLGFIFDGDGDRIFLLDEKGNMVRSDVTILLLAKYFLDKGKTSIVYNTICSKSVPEFIEKWGGKAIKAPVGFVNVREAVIKNKGMMGGELSGHYCFKDNYYGDSSLIAFLILLKVISDSGKKVSELAKEYSIYEKPGEINFEVSNKEKIIKKVKEKYSDGEQEYLDGVTVNYKDWWFNLRPSNTEPLLRLTIEANSKKLLEEKQREISEFVEGKR